MVKKNFWKKFIFFLKVLEKCFKMIRANFWKIKKKKFYDQLNIGRSLKISNFDKLLLKNCTT